MKNRPITAKRDKAFVRCVQDERRGEPRLRCRGLAEIKVLTIETRIPGTILDLSVSGCCIETNVPFPPIENPRVEVHLSINGATQRIAGVVRHVKQDRRAGIEFINVTERKAEKIQEMVEELIEMENER